MQPTGPSVLDTPLHTPEGIFVIHLRADSAAARQHLVGRVEHVQSGDTEPFTSLATLLAFIERHFAFVPPPSTHSSRPIGG